MKQHPLMTDVHIPFVTIEDIVEFRVDHNYVLYNPNLPEQNNRDILVTLTRLYFKRDIPEDQLTKFMDCKKDTEKFIDEFKAWIYNKK